MNCRALLLSVLLTCVSCVLRAQSYSLRLERTDGDTAALTTLLQPPPGFREPTGIIAFLQNVVPNLQRLGFLAASVDTLIIEKNTYTARIYLGRTWRWAKLSLGGLPQGLLMQAGISDDQFTGRPFAPKALGNLTERVLRWCEDNGYPFAQVFLDSIRMAGDEGINARLTADLGPLRKIDSVVISGNVRLDKAYLMRYLDVREGEPYNESRIRRAGARLRELPFLSDATRAYVQFRSIDTKLRVDLHERRANQFNLIIGLQPNTTATGKFLFTADGLAALQNVLGKGESFSFSYQKLQEASPRIKSEALYPFILASPFGAEAHFELYFRAEEYRRTTYDAGGRYTLSPQDFLRVYYRGYSNRVISVDTAYIRTNHRLPDNVDVSSGGGGLELQTSRVDYRLNPSRGWTGRIAAELLQRQIHPNDAITGIQDGSGFDYTHLFDSLNAATYQYHLSADLAFYHPLRKRMVIKLAYSGGWISGERLFQAELYQLGGFRSLRGFDEGSIFSNHYHMATAELRFLMSRASAVYLFSDNAWIQTKLNGFTAQGIYNGFGAGTTLETATGVFTLAYGLGRGPDNPVQLRQSKIHIGYAAYF